MNVDRTLTCADCGQEFVFTASEQQFYQERGFSDPRRCRSCRAARKASMGSGDSMGGGGGGYDSGYRREMFPVICAQCGKETEVPFQPRGDRPVYCRDCYDRVGGGGRSGGGGGRR